MTQKCPSCIFLPSPEPEQGFHIIHNIHESLVSFNSWFPFWGYFMTLKFLKNLDQTTCTISNNLYLSALFFLINFRINIFIKNMTENIFLYIQMFSSFVQLNLSIYHLWCFNLMKCFSIKTPVIFLIAFFYNGPIVEFLPFT